MYTKHNVALLLSILLLYNVMMTDCQEVVVYRNFSDSFRVGTDGCKYNSSICTTRTAKCLADGWCLCSKDSPNFRNPVIEGLHKYGKTYGCIKSEYILNRVGEYFVPSFY